METPKFRWKGWISQKRTVLPGRDGMEEPCGMDGLVPASVEQVTKYVENS